MGLKNKQILLGVCGGISCYKSADLVRCLRAAGAIVKVVMTQAAIEFVNPLTFETLSQQEVSTKLMSADSDSSIGHIALARWPDMIIIAPTTANFMAKIAMGIADDLLSTLVLARLCPLILAPAMNRQMWENSATAANVELLKSRDIQFLGPVSGDQACGETGMGRMMEAQQIVSQLMCCHNDELTSLNLLITAGPTIEDIDPVRFVSNRSSGKMGFSIARAAACAGAKVTLVSGPVSLPTPQGVERIDVRSASQMHAAVATQIADQDIFVAVAAVADYRVKEPANKKHKKSAANWQLELEQTVDILASTASLKDAPFCVGFAAETHDVEKNALAKLARKKLDIIVANHVGYDVAFDKDDNQLTCYWSGGSVELGSSSKCELSQSLIRIIAKRFQISRKGGVQKHEKNRTENSG